MSFAGVEYCAFILGTRRCVLLATDTIRYNSCLSTSYIRLRSKSTSDQYDETDLFKFS